MCNYICTNHGFILRSHHTGEVYQGESALLLRQHCCITHEHNDLMHCLESCHISQRYFTFCTYCSGGHEEISATLMLGGSPCRAGQQMLGGSQSVYDLPRLQGSVLSCVTLISSHAPANTAPQDTWRIHGNRGLHYVGLALGYKGLQPLHLGLTLVCPWQHGTL